MKNVLVALNYCENNMHGFYSMPEYDIHFAELKTNNISGKLEILKPEILFIDMELKGSFNCINTAKYIYGKYKIPIVFITNLHDLVIKELDDSSVPYDYLCKPLNQIKIMNKIAEISKLLNKSNQSNINHDTTYLF